MKVRFLLAAWIISGVILCMAIQRGEADVTVCLTSGAWPPSFSEQLSHHGIGSRIVTEAFAVEGIRVVRFYQEYRVLPIDPRG